MAAFSASTKLTDLHRRLTDLHEKTQNNKPWDDGDREVIVTGLAQLTLLVQELLLESKKPMREMPILPKRGY